MVLAVDVFEIQGDEQVKAGTISWNGQKYVLDPPGSRLLKSLIEEPVRDEHGMVTWRNASRFLAALPAYYRSAYVRVAKREDEDGGEKAIPLLRNRPALSR